MDNPKNQIVEQVKESSNVLVTVSANPSVDQLAAAIGLTLLLNKLGKHATAVFSGDVPSTINFLQPESTLEKNTDSLRDFIISLDKSKADKLRYKVEDKVVKIFITPYRTSISDQDLEFSQGDFNVDIVIGLGVRVREDLDQAITSHGRILHDATIVTINTHDAGNLGSINWVDEQASSLCEMVVATADMLKSGSLDEQMATALLTGIVAETDRFSNAKTTSNTMAASAKLMTAGANQQLVATKLQEPEQPSESIGDDNPPSDNEGDSSQDNSDGSLTIDHEELPEPQVEQIHIDEHGNMHDPDNSPQLESETRHMLIEPPENHDNEMNDGEDNAAQDGDNKLVMEPPAFGGRLTANSEPEALDPATDPLGQSSEPNQPLLTHDPEPESVADEPADNSLQPEQQVESPADDQPQPEPTLDKITEPTFIETPAPNPIQVLQQTSQATPDEPEDDQTLSEIEESVDSPHIEQEEASQTQEDTNPDGTPHIDAARDAVHAAMSAGPESPLEPIAALNAQPVNLDLGHGDPVDTASPQPQPFMPDQPLSQDIQIDPVSGNIQYPDQPMDINMPPLPPMPAEDPNLPPLPPLPPMPDESTLTPLGDTGLPTNLVPPMDGLPPDPTAPSVSDPTAPPPVPPPMMPPMPDASGSYTPTPNPFNQPPA